MPPIINPRFSLSTLASMLALSCACLAASGHLAQEAQLRRTDRQLDVAIVGEGFLQVSDPIKAEICYIRQGRLAWGADGWLVHEASGFPIEPMISYFSGTSDVDIAPDGLVVAKIDGRGPLRIGCMAVWNIRNPRALKREANGVYRANADSGYSLKTEPDSVLQQGWLESLLTPAELAVRSLPFTVGSIAAISLLIGFGRRAFYWRTRSNGIAVDV